jgi:hypothetical protein
LASTSGVPATSDTWQDYTVSFTTGPSVSGDLTVELSVAGASTYQANFDNVQLTTTPVLFLQIFRGSGNNVIVMGSGGTPNTHYTLLTAMDLSAPIWTTNSTGTLNGTGASSNSVPISAAARFFQLRTP